MKKQVEPKNRVTVVVNKNWEMDVVMSALVNAGLKAAALPFPTELYTPAYGEKTNRPRAIFDFKEGKDVVLRATVRCTQDAMYLGVDPDPATQSGSSSEEKLRVLPKLINEDDKADFVISVSTAGYPSPISRNGSVVIGANFFMHDGNPNNPKSHLVHPNVGKLLPCNVNKSLFGLINEGFKNAVEPKFLRTPRNPAEHACCIASPVFTALSVINITEYEEYNWADHEAMAHYNEVEKRLPCASSETTHGVVKLCTDKPILFLSPITDSFGNFDFEVTPAQNFASSFNGGIVLAELLCSLAEYVKSNKRFEL